MGRGDVDPTGRTGENTGCSLKVLGGCLRLLRGIPQQKELSWGTSRPGHGGRSISGAGEGFTWPSCFGTQTEQVLER